MTSPTIVYKIKDSSTNLYWGGKKGCVETIGTRFVTKSALNTTMKRIAREYKIWPEKWVVETVELTETVTAVRPAKHVIIDYEFVGVAKQVIIARGCGHYEAEAAASIIDSMRKLNDFSPYMALVTNGEMEPKDLRAFVKQNGGDPTMLVKVFRGWWAVRDLRTATVLRMNNDVSMMIDVFENVKQVCGRLDISPEELASVSQS